MDRQNNEMAMFLENDEDNFAVDEETLNEEVDQSSLQPEVVDDSSETQEATPILETDNGDEDGDALNPQPDSEAETSEVSDTGDDAPAEAEGESDNSDDNTEQDADLTQTETDFPKKEYKDNYYLLFGRETPSEDLDFEATKAFLAKLGFEGGELLYARKEKEKAHEFETKEENDSELFCSYCGLKISGVDYYRLRDNRCRCTICSRSLIKSIEQVEDIFKRIIKNMEILFDAVITTDIQIQLTDEKTIKKKCKLSVGDIDNNNVLIFGVAIKDKDGYSILIENSLPRSRVIATFVHELTHIWQYENWDKGQSTKKKKRRCIFKRKKKKGGQLAATRPLTDYEGMAKWAEIQYLYLIGESKIGAREEYVTRQRNDEYGHGFIKYASMYPLQKKTMTKGVSPFNAKNEREDKK